MADKVYPITHTGITAELLRKSRRHQVAPPTISSTGVQWWPVGYSISGQATSQGVLDMPDIAVGEAWGSSSVGLAPPGSGSGELIGLFAFNPNSSDREYTVNCQIIGLDMSAPNTQHAAMGYSSLDALITANSGNDWSANAPVTVLGTSFTHFTSFGFSFLTFNGPTGASSERALVLMSISATRTA